MILGNYEKDIKMVRKIELKRLGQWLEELAVILTGYLINEHGQIIESEEVVTILKPVDFDEVATSEYTYENTGGDYPIKIELSGKIYYLDYTLAIMLFDVADRCLWEVSDVLMDEIDDQKRPINKLLFQ